MAPALAFLLSAVLAQGAASSAQPASPPDGSTVTVTGCLAKGDAPGSFVLNAVHWDSTNTPTGKPGAHHEDTAKPSAPAEARQQAAVPPVRESLRLAGAATRLKLDAHLGHTITATGMLSARDPVVTPGIVLPDPPPAAKPGATPPAAAGGEPPLPRVLNLRSISHVAEECK